MTAVELQDAIFAYVKRVQPPGAEGPKTSAVKDHFTTCHGVSSAEFDQAHDELVRLGGLYITRSSPQSAR